MGVTGKKKEERRRREGSGDKTYSSKKTTKKMGVVRSNCNLTAVGYGKRRNADSQPSSNSRFSKRLSQGTRQKVIEHHSQNLPLEYIYAPMHIHSHSAHTQNTHVNFTYGTLISILLKACPTICTI